MTAPKPDPAELAQLRNTVQTQSAVLQRHEKMMEEVAEELRRLNITLLKLSPVEPTATSAVVADAQSPPPAASSVVVREFPLPHPDKYDGAQGVCRSFLTQCSLVFQNQPVAYATDHARIAYIVSLLRGPALEWASAVWAQQTPACACADLFIREFQLVFDHPVRGQDAAHRLLQIRQGARSVAEYAVEFRSLAVESGWNKEALVPAFHRGLHEGIQDELAAREDIVDLEPLISLAIRIDSRLRERRRRKPGGPGLDAERQRGATWSATATVPYEEPMEVGLTALSVEEREKRRREHRCLYCGRPGHGRRDCPFRPENSGAHPRPGGL